MSANTNPIFPAVLKTSAVQFNLADGTTIKTLLTAGSNGSRIDNIHATSDDTANRLFNVYFNDGSTDYKIGEVTVPLGSGTDGTTNAFKMLTSTFFPWLDKSGSIFLQTGWSLRIGIKQDAVTSAKVISIFTHGGDY